jgi:hypothetical protein
MSSLVRKYTYLLKVPVKGVPVLRDIPWSLRPPEGAARAAGRRRRERSRGRRGDRIRGLLRRERAAAGLTLSSLGRLSF